LTSRNKYYVDVRVYKPTDAGQPFLPNEPSDSQSITRLEWGFAGQSVSTPADYDTGELRRPAHTVWSHWVDSKTLDEVKDEGDMYPQANNEVLEKGAMANPSTGKITDYEELWQDLDPILVGSEEMYISFVLKLEEPSAKARGLVIRIGEWIEGVLRVGDAISVARWQWTGKGGWKRVVAIGELDLPLDVFKESSIREGGTFETTSHFRWACIEAYNWK